MNAKTCLLGYGIQLWLSGGSEERNSEGHSPQMQIQGDVWNIERVAVGKIIIPRKRVSPTKFLAKRCQHYSGYIYGVGVVINFSSKASDHYRLHF